MPLQKAMKEMVTSDGSTVFDHSLQQQVFLIFLRHFGCVFCRESLLDLSNKQEEFIKNEVKPIFVHMADYATAESFFKQFNLKTPIHVSDIECKFYADFGLAKGRFNQLFGLKSLVRGIEISTKGIFPTLKEIGDGYQMPGIFIVKDGKVLQSYIHNHAADKPDYQSLIQCCKF